MSRIGINGFGRIGRTTFRAWWERQDNDLEIVAINTSGSMDLTGWLQLLKHDSNYGRLKAKLEPRVHQSKTEVSDDDPVLGQFTISEGGRSQTVLVTAQRDPKKIPWQQARVELVLEATGVFRTEDKVAQHLAGGVKKVLISAPAKGGDVSSSVLGVNEFDLSKTAFSNASCTTNCVAPVTKIMTDTFGVEKAIMTTVHAYTDSQNLLDNSHKDLRRGRSAAINMVPTTTGAALATTKIIPQLEEKFDGLAVRIPLAVGSLADMVFLTERDTSVEEINQTFIEASQSDQWQGILGVTQEPLVSSDIVGRNESSIVDLSFTKVVDGNLVKILSWYDNEWGYCQRLLDQLIKLGS